MLFLSVQMSRTCQNITILSQKIGSNNLILFWTTITRMNETVWKFYNSTCDFSDERSFIIRLQLQQKNLSEKLLERNPTDLQKMKRIVHSKLNSVDRMHLFTLQKNKITNVIIHKETH
jgi:hypothetical protein